MTTSRKRPENKIQTIDGGIVFRHHPHLRIQSWAFHAMNGEVLLLLLAILLSLSLLTETETPSANAVAVADPGLLSFRVAFVLRRSRPLVVLVERVEVLDVRFPVLFEIAQNGEFA
jgi:hypothetical protein